MIDKDFHRFKIPTTPPPMIKNGHCLVKPDHQRRLFTYSKYKQIKKVMLDLCPFDKRDVNIMTGGDVFLCIMLYVATNYGTPLTSNLTFV